MQPVFFDTPGEIDLRATTTFGLSAKEGENPIGFFGTGLKYAIAIVMRHRGNMTFETGGEIHHLDVKKTDFRGQEFDAITMNGVEMPFTTHLGARWEMWMAYRELYCNTKDEKGVTHIDTHRPLPDGWSRISVIEAEFFSCHTNRHLFFIEEEWPIYKYQDIEIYDGKCPFLFYKGVRAYTPEYGALHRYNYTGNLDLTEDRTVTNSWAIDRLIGEALAYCSNHEVLKRVVTAPEGTYDACLCFPLYLEGKPSQAFMDVMRPLAHDKTGRVNKTAQLLYRQLTKKPGEHDYEEVTLSPIQQRVFNKAVAVCRDLGYDADKYEVLFVQSIGNGILGTAEDGKVFICQNTFEQGTKMVAGTLMEELMHLQDNVRDCSRNMQNLLINRIMTMYEEKTGEPL